jgi:hypothetical protein
MSEETEQVGNSETEGDSQSSGGSSQQSPDLSTLQKQVETLTRMFQGIQKGNDKVNARVEKQVNEALSGLQIGRIAELAKAGKSSEEIETQLLLDEILAERKASGATPGKESSGSGSEVQSALKQIAAAFELDANDAAVAEALSKSDLKALAGIVKSKASVPPPDATTQPPITSKEKQTGEADQKGLQTAYDKEVFELRKAGSWSAGKVADLRMQYRKKGLKI